MLRMPVSTRAAISQRRRQACYDSQDIKQVDHSDGAALDLSHSSRTPGDVVNTTAGSGTVQIAATRQPIND